MEQKAKIIETKEGAVDLAVYQLDDQRFAALLMQQHPMTPEQALVISRLVREAVDALKVNCITPAVLDTVLKAVLEERGVTRPIRLALDKSLFVPNGLDLTPNARTVLERRYLRKDTEGRLLERPLQMFERVARHIADAERNYDPRANVQATAETFLKLMTDLVFLPNSPTLMNAGRRLGQLAACFVLPVEDSMDAIFETLKNAAIIHKSGGGTGFSFSRLRPKNAMVGTTGGVASGPVSFMKIFNTATEQVKQGGTRRGANMAVLRVDHPDILEFIFCKQNNGDLNNFNISVGVTDAFMAAAARGEMYDLIDPATGTRTATLNATEVYNALVRQAWKNGDPGILFLDRINRDNPTPALGEVESTNPCGEQPLLPMEACNLGSINLARCVTVTAEKATVDYDKLGRIVHDAVHFLDNTIDMSRYPLAEIDAMVKGNRKVGLGVMGFADLLFKLGIPYNSEAALETAAAVMSFIQTEAVAASRALASQRGPFANHHRSIYADMEQPAQRNATLTTIAPTGTLSIIANCSSGIEPLFALSFVRNVMDDDRLLEVNPVFEAVARQRGFYSRELMETIARRGSIQHVEGIPDDVKQVFVTAHDISPEWHVRMQAAFQKFTDNAVSKTVNLPREATVEEVRSIYDLAYQLGCKGVTIYRDGSKEHQVLSTGATADRPAPAHLTPVRQRPETLEGFTTKIRTGYGHLYVTVTELDERPFEVFATIGKSGRSTTAKTEAIGRLVSLALRSGVEVHQIVEQLKGIGGEYPIFQEDGLVLSIPDAIARVLERRYLKGDRAAARNPGKSLLGDTCPECGQTATYQEGCQTCHFCGFTKCG
ncbi:vitamin B12-dependent ribonucleotide reductase [Desulfatitalea alkaliphila]|uniref:Vitamin B12-dependent ribonucleotide reductase n=1 Tax=Desulfatitalea alkaliphila TaxID=2929485 RepID=A0AA41R288_9BACT|nr:vitamin B12-dependent ribonucleotide reductase [Desulfatitalea alkaliphila]